MKSKDIKNLIILAWFVVTLQSAVGQDFYPLKIGNEWFYHTIDVPHTDTAISSSFKVVGDSLFTNGKRYFVLDHNDIMGGRFLRFDSSSIYYVSPYTNQEQKIFKLDGNVGDTVHILWGPYFIVRLASIDSITVLGIRQPMRRFVLDGLLYSVLTLSQKFGPIMEWRYGDPPPPLPDWGRELLGCVVDNVRYGTTQSVHGAQPQEITSFQLYQNFPNPFNTTTTISYYLNSSSHVLLRIYDYLGREVQTLVNNSETMGYHTSHWNGRNQFGKVVTTGTYFYVLNVGYSRLARQMVFAK
jgi:hypothetical protein